MEEPMGRRRRRGVKGGGDGGQEVREVVGEAEGAMVVEVVEDGRGEGTEGAREEGGGGGERLGGGKEREGRGGRRGVGAMGWG